MYNREQAMTRKMVAVFKNFKNFHVKIKKYISVILEDFKINKQCLYERRFELNAMPNVLEIRVIQL